MTIDSKPGWRRRAGVAIVALVVVALVAALAVGVPALVHHQSEKGRLSVGATRSGEYSMGDGYFAGSYRLVVPGAQISVNVETGRQASTSDDSADGYERLKAPENGLLVHLDWRVARLGVAGSDHLGDHPSTLRIRSKDTSVVAGRATAPKQATYSSEHRTEKLVALPGDVGDVKLEVEFAGRSQTVSLLGGRRDLGSFASLYGARTDSNRVVSMAQDQPTDPGSEFRWFCDALGGTVTRTPYLDRLGWAPSGQQWVLLRGAGYRFSEEAATWRGGNGVAYYSAAAKPTVSVTIGGTKTGGKKTGSKKALRTLGRPTTQSQGGVTKKTADYVFSVGTGTEVTTVVDVRARLKRTTRDVAQAPAHSTMRLRTMTTYPAEYDPTLRGQR